MAGIDESSPRVDKDNYTDANMGTKRVTEGGLAKEVS